MKRKPLSKENPISSPVIREVCPEVSVVYGGENNDIILYLDSF